MKHLVSALHKIQPKSGLVQVLGELYTNTDAGCHQKKLWKNKILSPWVTESLSF